ncbi:hypothetical protein L6452_17719 [Arctium lappa]|uniref:Uncharacterized protein n=1 Tax=Arctium lappa TaxID=4217 RepID=A0ACB9C4G6_ARCLA|nr:hypothetical protein L6452_17719 [Arctium lappa]
MEDLMGFADNHRLRVRKKSERIAIRTLFSRFKNTMGNPVDIDAEAAAQITRKPEKTNLRVKLKIPNVLVAVNDKEEF